MKTMTSLILAGLLGVGLFAPTKVECATCGITPIKPIVPIGCKDLAPICVTSGNGSGYWTWVCVK